MIVHVNSCIGKSFGWHCELKLVGNIGISSLSTSIFSFIFFLVSWGLIGVELNVRQILWMFEKYGIHDNETLPLLERRVEKSESPRERLFLLIMVSFHFLMAHRNINTISALSNQYKKLGAFNIIISWSIQQSPQQHEGKPLSDLNFPQV